VLRTSALRRYKREKERKKHNFELNTKPATILEVYILNANNEGVNFGKLKILVKLFADVVFGLGVLIPHTTVCISKRKYYVAAIYLVFLQHGRRKFCIGLHRMTSPTHHIYTDLEGFFIPLHAYAVQEPENAENRRKSQIYREDCSLPPTKIFVELQRTAA